MGFGSIKRPISQDALDDLVGRHRLVTIILRQVSTPPLLLLPQQPLLPLISKFWTTTTLRLNRDHAEGLRAIGLDGGLDAFEANLGKIHLPLDKRQWPDVELISLANQHRGIA